MPRGLQPRVRLIAVLREPADRMLSWYNHRVYELLVHNPNCGWCIFCRTFSWGSEFGRWEWEGYGALDRSAHPPFFRPRFDEEARGAGPHAVHYIPNTVHLPSVRC